MIHWSFGPRMRWFPGATVALIFAVGLTAPAYANGKLLRFDIVPQPLPQALFQFSEQTKIAVLSLGDVTKGKTSPGVRGEYSPSEALRSLLSGTGVTYEFRGDRSTVVIRDKAETKISGRRTATMLPTRILAQVQERPPANQTQIAQAEPTGPTTPPRSGSNNKRLEEIIVTGTLIPRQNYVANSPIVSVSAQTLNTFGSVELEQKLNYLPQFEPGETSFQAGETGGARNRTTLNLRGLTSTRTLVLLDGKRAQPSTDRLIVDVQTIPSSLIQRVDIITGGASAVYGSDAMAGVVNLILKKHYQGVGADVQTGFTQAGGGRTINADLTAGTDFANGRGNVVVNLNYFNREDVKNDQRDFFKREIKSGLGGTNVIPQGLYNPNVIGNVGNGTIPVSDQPFFGVFTMSGLSPNTPSAAAYAAVFGPKAVPGSSIGFNDDGTLFTQNNVVLNYKGPGIGDAFNIARSGDLEWWSQLSDKAVLQSPIQRYNGFAHFTYDLSDNINVYGQFMFTKSTGINTDASGARAAFQVWDLVVPATNPFIPPALATLLASRPDPTAPIDVTKAFYPIDRKVDIENSLYQILVGAKGSISDFDLKWEIYGSYGETDNTDTQFDPGGILWSRLENLLNAPDGGASICAGGFNPFGTLGTDANPISADCINYISSDLPQESHLSQAIAEATVNGGLFNLPAGKVRYAVGLNWRQDKIVTRLDSLINSDLPTGDVLIVSPSRPTAGKTSVWEIFGELNIPLLKDLPGIVDMSADLGYRRSDYRSSGSVNSYKADLSWTVVPSIRLRGGYERAIRAPNVGELYGGAIGGPVFIGFFFNGPGQGDPCDVRGALRNGPNAAQVRALCLGTGLSAANIDSFTYGLPLVGGQQLSNPDLHPEKADTFTGGVVWEPQVDAFNQLSLSVDYYNINLKDAVNPISGASALLNCFNVTGQNPTYDPNNMYCNQVIRTGGGVITNLATVLVNSGGIKTDGVEIQADAGFDLTTLGLRDVPGSLNFNFVGTYLNSFDITPLSGSPTLKYAGVFSNSDSVASEPQWKFNLTTIYSLGSIGMGLRWRFIDSMKDDSAILTPSNVRPGVKSYNTLDFFASWAINDRFTVRGGIDNLTDRDPNEIQGLKGVTNPNLYDPLGRRFYFAISAHF